LSPGHPDRRGDFCQPLSHDLRPAGGKRVGGRSGAVEDGFERADDGVAKGSRAAIDRDRPHFGKPQQGGAFFFLFAPVFRHGRRLPNSPPGRNAESMITIHRPKALLTALDRWYRAHARDLPWRVGPAARDAGEKPDPYLVWLSEVMLQQTTIPHAAPYFVEFRQRWPTMKKLAVARWEDVSAAWAGLGYYSRARNLHACAKAVAAAGGFPQDAAGLRKLPGIGPYTASAIAAIAFDEKTAPVDGNIERVASRVWAIGSDGTEAGWRAAKAIISATAQELFDALPARHRAGDLAQA